MEFIEFSRWMFLLGVGIGLFASSFNLVSSVLILIVGFVIGNVLIDKNTLSQKGVQEVKKE